MNIFSGQNSSIIWRDMNVTSRELYMFIENRSDSNKRKYTIFANLDRKPAKDIYDYRLAFGFIHNFVKDCARNYVNEYAPEQKVKDMFKPEEVKIVAEYILSEYEDKN